MQKGQIHDMGSNQKKSKRKSRAKKAICGESGGVKSNGMPCTNPVPTRGERCYYHPKSEDLERHENLSPKEQRFIERYLETFNATQSVKDAGYKVKNDNVAAVIGHELLRKPKIQRVIQERLETESMSAGEITQRFTNMGRGDVKYFLKTDQHGQVAIDLNSALAKKHSYLIKKVSQWKKRSKDGNEWIIKTVIELHDAQAAMDKLAKAQGLYRDETNINVLVALMQAPDEEIRTRLDAVKQRLMAAKMN